jgi:predicted nucleic acid-binding protein
MKSDCFIDTNIWVYAFLEAEKDSGKQATAIRFLQGIVLANRIIVSAQVINEFHWILSRKYKIPEELIREKVENGLVKLADIVPLEYSDYQFSFHIRRTWGLSFWDSLIVASALQNECSTLYSEDLSHGIMIEKTLQVVNPFL